MPIMSKPFEGRFETAESIIETPQDYNAMKSLLDVFDRYLTLVVDEVLEFSEEELAAKRADSERILANNEDDNEDEDVDTYFYVEYKTYHHVVIRINYCADDPRFDPVTVHNLVDALLGLW